MIRPIVLLKYVILWSGSGSLGYIVLLRYDIIWSGPESLGLTYLHSFTFTSKKKLLLRVFFSVTYSLHRHFLLILRRMGQLAPPPI